MNNQEILQHSFLCCLSQEIQSLRKAKRFGQASRIESARNSFVRFLRSQGRADLTLGELTATLVLAYQQWLGTTGVVKNSSSCYIRSLQSVFNKAASGLPIQPANPFAKVYRGIAKTRKRATNISVIQHLRELDIPHALAAIGKSPCRRTFASLLRRVTFARDLFIFSYCARGMAFVDLAYLKKEDVRQGIICYRRRKTGQQIEVALEPIMREIIERYAAQTRGIPYLFPILRTVDEEAAYRAYRTALRTYNNYLKQLSAMLGEEVCLTSYVARHSWASVMHELDMPISVISQGLGHDSELTTQIYIKSLENNKIHGANKFLIDHTFFHPFLSHERDILWPQRYVKNAICK